jgi:hypothetical protein
MRFIAVGFNRRIGNKSFVLFFAFFSFAKANGNEKSLFIAIGEFAL